MNSNGLQLRLFHDLSGRKFLKKKVSNMFVLTPLQ